MVAVAPDGSRVAAAGVSRVAMYSWPQATKLWSTRLSVEKTGEILGLAFPPGTDVRAVAGAIRVCLLDAATGAVLRELPRPGSRRGYPRVVSFGPNGLLFVGATGGVVVVDPRTGDTVWEAALDSSVGVLEPLKDSNGTLCGVWQDIVWVSHSKRAWRTVATGHLDKVRALDSSADGRWVVSGGWDRRVCLWRVVPSNGEFRLRLVWSWRGRNAITSVVYAERYGLVFAGTYGGVLVLHAATGRKIGELAVAASWCMSLALTPDGETLIGAFTSLGSLTCEVAAVAKEVGVHRGRQ